MRGNRRRDTYPERRLRSELHRLGLRFRVDHALAPAGGRPIRPDVVFTRARIAVFVDGCFWHRCPTHGVKPRTNAPYWNAKLDRNVARDARHNRTLKDAGWEVIRVWEHEDSALAAKMIASRVTPKLAR
jgi:DNA mismatch endonuclease (patch repair protein)